VPWPEKKVEGRTTGKTFLSKTIAVGKSTAFPGKKEEIFESPTTP
jgi:hypothetical protein